MAQVLVVPVTVMPPRNFRTVALALALAADSDATAAGLQSEAMMTQTTPPTHLLIRASIGTYQSLARPGRTGRGPAWGYQRRVQVQVQVTLRQHASGLPPNHQRPPNRPVPVRSRKLGLSSLLLNVRVCVLRSLPASASVSESEYCGPVSSVQRVL